MPHVGLPALAIMSDPTRLATEGKIPTRSLGEVQVKGKTLAVAIHTPG